MSQACDRQGALPASLQTLAGSPIDAMQVYGDRETPKKPLIFQGALPAAVETLLNNCPQSGSGNRLVHRWIMECGNQLRHYVFMDTATELIARKISRRPKGREIEETLEKAYSEPATGNIFSRNWPDPDSSLIDMIVTDTDDGIPPLKKLRKCSKPIPASTHEVLSIMFSGNPLLCAGVSQTSAAIAPLARLKDPQRFQFIVPNPMASQFMLVNGKAMKRCLANVLERRYIVLDFDLKGDWIQPVLERWQRVKYTPQDGMASLISFMERDPAPALAVLVVFSGNVSLQAWYYCKGIEEQRLAAWFSEVCLIGADPAGWTRCQYFRMPRGVRDGTGAEQKIVYFNPDAIEPAFGL